MQSGVSSFDLVFVTQDVPGFVQRGLGDAGLSVDTIDDGQFGTMLETSSGPVALFWDIPAKAVSRSLRAGVDPAGAISDWLERHLSLLRLVRRHRRGLRLFDARLLSPWASAPDQDRLAAALGLDSAPRGDMGDVSRDETLAYLLASLMIPKLEILRSCLDELEAGSLTRKDETWPLSMLESAGADFDHIRGLTKEVQTARDKADNQAQALAAAETELTRTSDALAKARDDLSEAQTAERTKEQELALLREQLRLQSQEEERAAAEAEARLMEIGDLQRLVAAEAAQRTALQERLDATDRQLQGVQQERDLLTQAMEELHESTSWKVTKPLRQIRTFLAPVRKPD